MHDKINKKKEKTGKTINNRKLIHLKPANPKWLNIEIVLQIILALIIFAVALYRISDLNQLKIYSDEYGYWAGSAYFTGNDWSSVTSGIYYYSYGYGILLIPIRLLFPDSADMYRAAVLLNGVMLVVSYLLALKLCGRYFKAFSGVLNSTVCFLAVIYPSNIVFSHITWAETALTFVFWIFAFVMMKVIDKPSVMNHICLAFVISYMFIVHQRSLGIMIATIIIILYLTVRKENKWYQTTFFFGTLAVCMLVHSQIKSGLINDFYRNNAGVAANNLAGQATNLKTLLTGEGFLRLIFSIGGKWLYLAASTGMFLFWAARDAVFNAWEICGDFIRRIRTGSAGVKFSTSPSESGEEHKTKLWKFAMFLAFAGTFSISAVYMAGIGRMDNLMYGRYNEFIIGIFIIYSIYIFIEDGRWLDRMIAYSALSLTMGAFCGYILNSVGNTIFEAAHSITMSSFLQNGVPPEGGVVKFVALSVVIGLAAMVLIKVKTSKASSVLRTVGGLLVLAAVWIYIGIHAVNTYVVPTHMSFLTVVTPIAEGVKLTGEDAPIYYFADTVDRFWAEGVQFQLPDKSIIVTSKNDKPLQEDAYYIMGNGYALSEEVQVKCEIIASGRVMSLAILKEGRLSNSFN